MGGAPKEIVHEAVRILTSRAPTIAAIAGAMLLAIAVESFLVRIIPPSTRRRIRLALVALTVAAGLILAWRVLWLADDAFISFRYARNLALGHGLVFNEGEWVEGYTNFLWTALLGGLGWLGVDIPSAGLFGNLLCFAGSLILAATVVSKLRKGEVVIPFAAIALAGLAPFHTFASSGLETMPLAFLVAAAMWVSTRRHGPLLAGAVLIAAAMTRPDHLLLYGCMGVAIALEGWLAGERRLEWKRLVAYAAPFVLVYVPYFLTRWRVYGDLMPNTYYAKSGGLSYFHQGWVYLVHFAFTSGAWLWFPLFVASLARRPRDRDEARLLCFALLSSLILGAYVVKVGGDFMEHRFFVSLLPAIAIAFELSCRSLVRVADRTWFELEVAGFAALSMAFALVPVRLIGPFEKRWHLAAEHTFYPVLSVFPLEVAGGFGKEGLEIRRHLEPEGLRPPVAGDAIGLFAWYSELPIVDAFGLTNRRIAHKPIEGRGRPGHEKFGTIDELIEEGAVLSLWPAWGERWMEETSITVGTTRIFLLREDPELKARLATVSGVKLPPDLGERAKDLVSHGSREEALEALPFYRHFLAGTPDHGPIVSALEGKLREIADFEGRRLPAGATWTGRALELEEGRPPLGASGTGWLSSLSDAGDRVGRLEIPLPTLDGSELRFALGGPRSPSVSVRLLVGGEVVREALSTGGTGLGPVSWMLGEYEGASAVLVIADEDPSPGAGILVDGIHFAPREGDIRHRIERWLAKGEGDPAALLREAQRHLPKEDETLRSIDRAVLARWTFDDGLPPGSEIHGTAFGTGPVDRESPGQQPIHGVQGRFLNSYQPDDRAKGMVALPMVELGGAIAFKVGGGRDCKKTYVGLEVRTAIVARVCGKTDERLRPATISTVAWRGQQGRVVIVDHSSGPWGHILADDVIVFRAEGDAAFATGRRTDGPQREADDRGSVQR